MVLRLAGYTLTGFLYLYALCRLSHQAMKCALLGMAAGMLAGAVIVLVVCSLDRLGFLKDVSLSSIDVDFNAVLIALFLPPVLFGLWRFEKRIFFWLILAVAVPAVMINQMLATKVALLSGGLVFLLTLRFPRKTGTAIFGLVTGLVLAFPLLIAQLPSPQSLTSLQWLPYSSVHRLVIWEYTVEKIEERPALGWGFNNARRFSRLNDTVTLTFPSGETVSLKAMPSHPHNVSVQLWLDTGSVGVGLFLALLGGVFFCLHRKKTSSFPYACALACLWMGFVISFVSYNFWDRSWQLSLWLLASLCYRLMSDPGLFSPTPTDRSVSVTVPLDPHGKTGSGKT